MKLDSVTLVAVDTFAPPRTIKTMEASLAKMQFHDAILVCMPGVTTSSTSIRLVPSGKSADRLQRELFILQNLWSEFSTSHALHMEWDSGIRNGTAWDDGWLAYDYIGAPWEFPKSNEFPPCHAGNCVGNFGFALVSKRFLEAVSRYPVTPEQARLSDVWMCRALRPLLESQGMRYAPLDVALKFSCENRRYTNQFGWHGRLTAKMNGWTLS